MLYSFNRSAIVVLTLASCLTVSAQCDPLEVDFGEEPWGLAPDGVETFFDACRNLRAVHRRRSPLGAFNGFRSGARDAFGCSD